MGAPCCSFYKNPKKVKVPRASQKKAEQREDVRGVGRIEMAEDSDLVLFGIRGFLDLGFRVYRSRLIRVYSEPQKVGNLF